jgi:hypothetical protein
MDAEIDQFPGRGHQAGFLEKLPYGGGRMRLAGLDQPLGDIPAW